MVSLSNKLSADNFKDFEKTEDFVEDGIRYDLYKKDSTLSVDGANYSITEYKTSMYNSDNEVIETLYYKEIFDEKGVKIAELTELYDNNGNLEGAESIINYTENGIALTKQNDYILENGSLKTDTTVSWNPEDVIKKGSGEGFTGLKPIKLFGYDDDNNKTPAPVDKSEKITQKINELNDQINAKEKEKEMLKDDINDISEQISELNEKLDDLKHELIVAYQESFSDVEKTARDYDVVQAEINQVEAQLESLRNQYNSFQNQMSAFDTEITDLKNQIADYGNSAKARDYFIDYFEQGEINSCNLLSELKHLGDLSNTDIITWNDDGSADVKLRKIVYDDPNTQFVGTKADGSQTGYEMGDLITTHIEKTDLDSGKITVNGKDYQLTTGDLTVQAIEYAHAKVNGVDMNSSLAVSKSLGLERYSYLGNTYGDKSLEGATTCSLPANTTTYNNILQKYIGTKMDSDGSLTINDTDGNPVKFGNNHQYEVKYDGGDTVKVTNPYDTENKVHTIDKELFKKTFNIVTTHQRKTSSVIWSMKTKLNMVPAQ